MSMKLLATITLADEAASLRFAQWLAPILRAGDIISLEGELGVGKTFFARGIIHCLCGAEVNVPSPSFTLVQHYQAGQNEIVHADFYRLEKPQEVDELGLFDDCAGQIMLLEWADKLGNAKPANCLCLCLADEFPDENSAPTHDRVQGAENTVRYLTIYGTDEFASRLAAIATYSSRDHALMQFVGEHGWQSAKYTPIMGDASARRYLRLVKDKGQGVKSHPARRAMCDVTDAVLMDWPPRVAVDKRKTYAAQTHLARNPAAFVAIANFLISCGLSAPRIYGYDFTNGFLLLEDFGTQTFTHFIDTHDKGLPIYYREAIAALAHLHKQTVPPDLPLSNGENYKLHDFDIEVLMAELSQFLDFYLAGQGVAISQAAGENWQAIWRTILPKIADMPPVLVLRDYHSPNLHWLVARQTIARVGMIDIQDALLGSPAYDVVSLLQDARRDIDADLCAQLLDFYFAERQLDKQAEQERFKQAYAILGAQRNFRIAGVFMRLAQYHNKPSYLVHLPRVMNYIEKNLQHPALADMKIWMQENVPPLKQ